MLLRAGGTTEDVVAGTGKALSGRLASRSSGSRDVATAHKFCPPVVPSSQTCSGVIILIVKVWDKDRVQYDDPIRRLPSGPTFLLLDNIPRTTLGIRRPSPPSPPLLSAWFFSLSLDITSHNLSVVS